MRNINQISLDNLGDGSAKSVSFAMEKTDSHTDVQTEDVEIDRVETYESFYSHSTVAHLKTYLVVLVSFQTLI